MKTLLTLLLAGILATSANSQFEPFKPHKIMAQYTMQEKCMNDMWMISKTCASKQQRMYILLTQSFIDRKKKKLHIVGRIASGNDLKSSGISGVKIVKAKKDNDKLIDEDIAGVTGDKGNAGSFDIIIHVRKKEGLYFYKPGYYLEEIKISHIFL